MYNLDDYVEFTKKKRQEHSMRGFEPEDLLLEGRFGTDALRPGAVLLSRRTRIWSASACAAFISRTTLPWDGRAQAEFVIDKLDFETAQERERTFNIYAKNDDIHANGLHDYLKYLKFGYGRATDDASNEVRHGRMSRERAIEMVAKYDHVRPSDMDVFLNSVGMTEAELLALVEPMRDPSIWKKGADGVWRTKDNVGNHIKDPGVEAVRQPLRDNVRPFAPTPEKVSPHAQRLNEQTEYVLL